MVQLLTLDYLPATPANSTQTFCVEIQIYLRTYVTIAGCVHKLRGTQSVHGSHILQ